MIVNLTAPLIAKLKEAGVECFLRPGQSLPRDVTLEPPCSLKWMAVHQALALGAFSYAVSGFYCAVRIGRYTSIGESVQIGRGSHPTTTVSTSPAFYTQRRLFDVGLGFPAGPDFQTWKPKLLPEQHRATLKTTTIGNDVYIGHGAFIRPGTRIGDGAIVGAHAVVVKDVPPYAVVAGNPATIRKLRLPTHLIGRMLAAQWWRFAPWQLATVDMTEPEAVLDHFDEILPTLESYAPPVISLGDFAEAAG